MSKIILITGSNTGIGFELARLIAQEKHTVYISARKEASGKEALKTLHDEGLTSAKLVILDVTKPSSIEAAVSTITAAEGKLDILINNAGISLIDADQKAPSVSVDVIREVMETNYYGVVQTTTAFLPLLKMSEAPEILNVSSPLGSNTLQAGPNAAVHLVAYNSSKAALNSYTIALASELAKEGVKVNAVSPGYVATNLNNHSAYAQPVRTGAEAVLRYVSVGKDGPTGKFFDEKGSEFPW